MKLVKLSLVGILALGSCVYASDNLAEAFKNGKTMGSLRFVYTTGSDTDAATQTRPVDNANVGSVAVELRYTTDNFYGFKLGLGAQSAHDLGFHDKDAGDGGVEDDERNSVSTTLLSEAYIQYSFLKSDIKVGRQKIKTPLIMSSSAFALEDSFDAIVLSMNELPDTFVKLIYVQEWQMRYGSDARNTPTQKDMHFKKGLYSLFFKNQSIKDLTLDGQYLTTNEEEKIWDAPVFVPAGGYDQYYLQAKYKLPLDFPLFVAMTYAKANYENPTVASNDDATLYGFKISSEVSGVKLDAAYTTMDEEANFPGTFGHVPDAVVYTDMLTNNAIFAGIDAYSLGASYGFGVAGLNTSLKYAHYDQSAEGITNAGMDLDDADEVNIDIKYAFSGALKGLSTRLWAGYGTYDVSGEDDFTYARFYLAYNF